MPLTVTAPEFAQILTKQYGPLLHGKALLEVLGYPNTVTLRKAIVGKRIDLKIFPVPGRRGPFVLTIDAAQWLVSLRDAAGQNNQVADPFDPERLEKRPMS